MCLSLPWVCEPLRAGTGDLSPEVTYVSLAPSTESSTLNHSQLGEKNKVRNYFRSKSKPLSYRTTTISPSLYFSMTDSFSTCPIRKPPAVSQFLPNHHLFLMDYADTTSQDGARPVQLSRCQAWHPVYTLLPARGRTPGAGKVVSWSQLMGSPGMGQEVAGWGGTGAGRWLAAWTRG